MQIRLWPHAQHCWKEIRVQVEKWKCIKGCLPLLEKFLSGVLKVQYSVQTATTRCMFFCLFFVFFFFWPSKNRLGGRICFTILIHVRRVTVNLVNWLEFLWTQFLENVFTCGWLELNSPMDDAASVGGRLLVFPRAWVTHRSPKISLIQKLSQAWDYLKTLMLSKFQTGCKEMSMDIA